MINNLRPRLKFSILILSVVFCLLGCRGAAFAAVVAVVSDADGTAFFLDDKGAVWAFLKPDDMTGLVRLPGMSKVKQLVPFAALEEDGRVVTWDYGVNTACHSTTDGPLGRDVTYTRPTEVSGLTGVVAISGIDRHFLALLNDGTVVAFGRKLIGQNGWLEPLECGPVPSYDRLSAPQYIKNFGRVISVSAGIGTDTVLTSDGNIYSWGRVALTSDWQMNLDREVLPSHPEKIFIGLDKTAIFSNGEHLLALTKIGDVRVWGVCLDGSPKEGGILSGVTENVRKVKKIIISPDPGFSPSGYILEDGKLALLYTPDVAGIVEQCGLKRVESTLPSPEIVPGPSIRIRDAALTVGSELGNNWILMVGVDGSVWQILRGPFGAYGFLSKVLFP